MSSRGESEPVRTEEDDLVLPVDENPWVKPKDEPTTQEASSVTVEPKKRKDVLKDAASQKRNSRMFGVMLGTLNKFKQEGSKQSDAAKRRSEIEGRLHAKLRAESEKSERKAERSRLERQLKNDVLRKQDERALLESIHRKRHDTALNLANFLVTPIPKDGDAASSRPALTTRPPPNSKNLPMQASPAFALPPVYYLPAKLLPWQSDMIKDQVKLAEDAVDDDRQDLKDDLIDLDKEIEVLKEKRDQGLEEIEREERAARAQREREARDAEEQNEGNGKDVDMADATANGSSNHKEGTRAASATNDADHPMEDAVEF